MVYSEEDLESVELFDETITDADEAVLQEQALAEE